MTKENLFPLPPNIAVQERIALIEEAVGEGVLERIPLTERGQDIGIVRNLNPDLTLQEIGKLFPNSSGKPLTRERVRQIGKAFLNQISLCSSPQLRGRFDLQAILSKRRVRLRQNSQDLQPIKVRVGFGVKVEAENDDKKLQEILDSQSAESLRDRGRKDKRVLTSLSSLLRSAGFYPRKCHSQFAETIARNGIPIRVFATEAKIRGKFRQQYYYVVYTKHQDRITAVLNQEADLQKFKENPVKQICGPKTSLPTSTELMKKERYTCGLAGIIKEVRGHRVKGGKYKVEDFLAECPIPIYKIDGHYFYPKDRTEALKAFLRAKQLDLQSKTRQG